MHPELRSNAVDPGWVATKMGGAGAPDDFESGGETQAWLAVSEAPAAEASGRLFYHLRPADRSRAEETARAALRVATGEACESISPVTRCAPRAPTASAVPWDGGGTRLPVPQPWPFPVHRARLVPDPGEGL